MALTPDQIKTDYPLPVYNYRVDIGTATIAFSEISGMEMSFDTISYSESRSTSGKPGPVVMHMPGQAKPVQLTLRKGYVRAKSIAVLYDWIKGIELNRVEKKDVTVHLCDEKGISVVRWKVIDAFPTKLTAPTFSATANDVAIESIELMASSLEISEG